MELYCTRQHTVHSARHGRRPLQDACIAARVETLGRTTDGGLHCRFPSIRVFEPLARGLADLLRKRMHSYVEGTDTYTGHTHLQCWNDIFLDYL